MSRFRAFQTRINQGFFRGCQRVRDTFILFPGNGVLNAYKPPKSTRTQGGDTIADYIKLTRSCPPICPIPVLFKMEISQTAKLLYALLLDRSTLSQKNKWQDGEGRIYIIYPIAEMIAEILDKGSTTIKGALNELERRGCWNRNGALSPHRTD